MRYLARTLLLVGSLLFFWGVLEAPALFGMDWRRVAGQKVPGGKGPLNRVYDRDFLWIRPPHDHFRARLPGDSVLAFGAVPRGWYEAEYVYDRHGLRNASDIEQADVLVLGDSFAAGYKVAQDLAVASLVQGALGRTVMNLAHCGWGPDQARAALERFGLAKKPKLAIWFVYAGNDHYDQVRYEDARKDWEGYLADEHALWKRSFSRNVLYPRLLTLRILFRSRDPEGAKVNSALLQIGSETPKRIFFETQPPDDQGEWRALRVRWRATAGAILEALRARGAELLLVYVPTKWEVYQPYLTYEPGSFVADFQANQDREDMAEWAAKKGVRFVDLTGPLRAPLPDETYYPDDMHWSPLGHQVAAKAAVAAAEASF